MTAKLGDLPVATAVTRVPPAAPLTVALPVAPPPPASKRTLDSDEYSPDETGDQKRRTAALTNRQAGMVGVDVASVPAATSVTAGTDPFDPDLFERMAREAHVEWTDKSPDAGQAMPPAERLVTPITTQARERTITSRQVTCPVCGHDFPSDSADDVPQVCPQCHTTFNLAKGHVVSGGARPTGGDPLLGRVLRGCLIDRKVGEGGMGAVYHARQLSLDRSVAIKVLPPELARNRNFISRFEREAKSLARINHPNILHIYDFGEDSQLGIYFMIIEFVEGRDLGDMLHESYTLGQIEVLDIIRQASMGLEQAAEKGVIHRDIKPDNLMLTENGICKVSDFGLAKATSAEKDVTTIGVRVGTPAFMSPEQCDGEDVDFRSDIYNLGCTAFLALTGQLPYDADTPFAIMLKHKNDPVPSPRMFNPNLDSRVESLVMRMIAKRPADRFDTLREMVELVEDLEVKLAGTSTILRKTRGPFRAMSDLEAVEHARLTSSGIRNAVGLDPALAVSAVPTTRPASSVAPVGPSEVPDWLKPVQDTKQRKTTSNLQALPTPKPTPQASTTSQREMKDLRSKLTEARERNKQDEAHTLEAEGDRLAANGQLNLAADAWTRAATLTPNALEATSLLQKAAHLRRGGRGFVRIIKFVIILAFIVGGLVGAAFYGVPVGHNMLADRELSALRAIAAPQPRVNALESFIATYGRPLDLYVTIFKRNYPVVAVDQAASDVITLKKQLEPPVVKVERSRPTKADEEMARLLAMRDDSSVAWMAVAAEARRMLNDGEAKDRARPVLELAEKKLAEMSSDYEAISKQWSSGHQGKVTALAAEFRAKHPRAGADAPSALPGRLEVVDGDNGRAPDALQITTRVKVVDGGNRGVFVGESRLAVGELQFSRYPQTPVELEIAAPGYRTERIQVSPDADPAERLVRVRLHPGEAWRAQVARTPRWLSVKPLAGTPFALVCTPEHLALARLSSGELRSSLTRSQASARVIADGASWTNGLTPSTNGFTVGTTDGLALEVLIDDGKLRLGELIHRADAPLLACIDKDLTFLAKRAVFAITAVDKGMVLKAHTPDTDLWELRGLVGLQRPILWAQDDRILVLDDRQLQALDEAEGRVIAMHPLPGIRSGAPARFPESDLLAIPTAAGPALLRVGNDGMISEIEDKALSESRARLLAQDEATLLTAAQDRTLHLLAWNGSVMNRMWGATLPMDAGVPTWLALGAELAAISDDRGTVYLLSRLDGSLKRTITHAASLLCPPVLAEGRVVLADRDGNLVAYHLPPLP